MKFKVFLSFSCVSISGSSPNTTKTNTGQQCKHFKPLSLHFTNEIFSMEIKFAPHSKHTRSVTFVVTIPRSTVTSPTQKTSLCWMKLRDRPTVNHPCAESRAESTAARAWTASTCWTPMWVKDCIHCSNASVWGGGVFVRMHVSVYSNEIATIDVVCQHSVGKYACIWKATPSLCVCVCVCVCARASRRVTVCLWKCTCTSMAALGNFYKSISPLIHNYCICYYQTHSWSEYISFRKLLSRVNGYRWTSYILEFKYICAKLILSLQLTHWRVKSGNLLATG